MLKIFCLATYIRVHPLIEPACGHLEENDSEKCFVNVENADPVNDRLLNDDEHSFSTPEHVHASLNAVVY